MRSLTHVQFASYVQGGHRDGYTKPLPEEELHLVTSVDSDKETD